MNAGEISRTIDQDSATALNYVKGENSICNTQVGSSLFAEFHQQGKVEWR